MKKGELIALNMAFGKLTLPDMRMEDLYPILSTKADIGEESDAIEAKAAKFRDDTKPKTAGDFEISLADPANRDWWNKSMAMRARLLEEEAETKVSPCIPRDLFAQMAKGLTTAEATLVFTHLVKQA